MRVRLSILTISLLSVSCWTAADPRSTDPPVAEVALFQEQVEQATIDSRIPGLVVALREPDGRELVAAVGLADLEAGIPMRNDHLFYIGTISQSMLAVAVLMLAEESRLELTDPIAKFLEFPAAGAVIIEMLLDHSSGLADWTGNDLATTDNARMPELLRTEQTVDSLLAVAAADEPEFGAGERQEASYTNMLLLSKLIESVEGKSAQIVLEERIFEPLGLTDTRYLTAEEELTSRVRGYRAEEGWGEPLPGGLTEVGWADRNLRALADMGLVSTATDVLRYHAALREGRLISEESVERLHTVRPGKINGLGYLVMSGGRGTWEGNTGHAVGHLGINLFHGTPGRSQGRKATNPRMPGPPGCLRTYRDCRPRQEKEEPKCQERFFRSTSSSASPSPSTRNWPHLWHQPLQRSPA